MKPLQFNLKQMLGAMLALAVLFAVTAPIMQRLSPGRLAWMAAALGAGAAGFGITTARLARKRARFDAIAGKVLLQLGRPSLSSEINRFILICFAAFEALLIVTTALFPRPSYSTFPPDDEIGMALNVALAAGMGACISLLWWNSKDRYVELCERGIIARGQSFARWGQIRRIGWADDAELKMTCKNRTIYVKIVSRQREAVESLLAAKLSSVRLREKQRPDSAPASETGLSSERL